MLHIQSYSSGCITEALTSWLLPFHIRATGAEFPFHKSIIRSFMVYQGRIETNSLQLFAHLETSEWFSIISGIIFEINIVSEQK